MRLTLQSDMCGSTLEEVIAFHLDRGLSELDLKTGLAGEPVETMTLDDARRARAMLDAAGLGLYCLSTSLFAVELAADGRAVEDDAARLQELGPVIDVLAPRYVRVLAAIRPEHGSSPVAHLPGAVAYAAALRSSAADLTARGTGLLIENGPENSVVSSAANARQLAELIGTGSTIGFIWDVQNMWQSGSFPRASDPAEFGSLLKYVHVKGGRTAGPVPGELVSASTLADASWPVVEVLDAVRELGTVECIALNPSHGRHESTTPDSIRDHDIDFLTDYLAATGAPAAR